MLVKQSFRELCDSKLSGLCAFDNITTALSQKEVKNAKVHCEFMRR